MKITLLLAALVLLPALANAQASAPAANESAPPAVGQASGAPAGADESSSSDNRNCLKQTGSRIKPRADAKGRRCVSAPGASYDKEDIDRTGATDLKDALRRLDPAVH